MMMTTMMMILKFTTTATIIRVSNLVKATMIIIFCYFVHTALQPQRHHTVTSSVAVAAIVIAAFLVATILIATILNSTFLFESPKTFGGENTKANWNASNRSSTAVKLVHVQQNRLSSSPADTNNNNNTSAQYDTSRCDRHRDGLHRSYRTRAQPWPLLRPCYHDQKGKEPSIYIFASGI